jgi:DNA-binding NtrC family response regulator
MKYKHKKLTEAQRNFLTHVAQAAFINPFSDERKQADKKMAALTDTPKKKSWLDQGLVELSTQIETFRKNKQADIHLYQGKDHDIVKTAFLFHVFHHYVDSFDQLIQDQMVSGDQSSPVSFAIEAIDALTSFGFTHVEAERYFAVFYQIRRAYYFIYHGLIGISPCMKRLRRHLWDNVFTSNITIYENILWNRMEDFSTLLLGETGTGKGAAAAAIGRSGFIPFVSRKQCFKESFTSIFISLNLSQFSSSIIESELFGHRKGAFTGAMDHHVGIFSCCSPHGAIFLDEIGEVSIPIQIKLLQVLQERIFSPVGSHEKKKFSGRVIAATNQSIQHLRQQGGFRNDFYYRLCSDTITVPTLHQRIQEEPEELPLLVNHILKRLGGESASTLTPQLVKKLQKSVGQHYNWPGNVRELEQAVRRILLKGQYTADVSITSTDFETNLIETIKKGELDVKELTGTYCKMLYERLQSYEKVAQRTQLDWRTVKKYVEQ